MTEKSMAQVPAELYELLAPFSSEERIRIVQATMVLLGEQSWATATSRDEAKKVETPPLEHKQEDRPEPGDPGEFFALKKPDKKVEQFAVAARYRELRDGVTASTVNDFEAVFSAARISFERDKFSDDMRNSRNSGLFTVGGTPTTGYTLSLYGQKFVDVLPDGDVARQLTRSMHNKPRKLRKPGKK